MFFLTFLSAQSLFAQKICGKVVKIRGKAEIFRVVEAKKIDKKTPRNFFIAKKKDKLWCSDIIVTHKRSRARLRIGRGSISLGSNARLEIANYLAGKDERGSVMDLIYGKMRASVKKKNDNSKFRVTTPTTVMGVRGTDFFIDHDPLRKTSKHAILEGEVEVLNVKTETKTIVTTGSQLETNVDKPEAKVEPIDTKTVMAIKGVSDIVKDDSDFTSDEAIKILGPPEGWERPKYEIPDDLKGKREEF